MKITKSRTKEKIRETNLKYRLEASRIKDLAIEQYLDEFAKGIERSCKEKSYKWRRENPCTVCNIVSTDAKYNRAGRIKQITQEIKEKEKELKDESLVYSINK